MSIIALLARCAAICVLAHAASSVQAENYPSHRGNSPVGFDEFGTPSDTFVVNDADSPDLDVYDFRRSGTYDFVIPLNLRRVLGDKSILKARGLLSPTATIIMPAYDVDEDGARLQDCDGDGTKELVYGEVNEVYFNDELLGTLRGADNIWTLNTFDIPIEQVNFPSVPGEVGENFIQIKIDVANINLPLSGGGVGCKVWATEIDWVALEYEAASPVVFATGLFGSPGSFQASGYQENLRYTLGLPSEIFGHSTLTPSTEACNSSAIPALTAHVREMTEFFVVSAAEYGSSSFHLIGHSMGGLDARLFIHELQSRPLLVEVGRMSGQPVLSELRIDSLVTHGTPHAGTLVADYGVSLRRSAQALIYGASDICDLTTHVMREVNRRVRIPSHTRSLLIGSDADNNGDNELDAAELSGNQITQKVVANMLYRLLRDNDAVRSEYTQISALPPLFAWVTVLEPSSTVHLNDTQSTIQSSLAAPGATRRRTFVQSGGKNHGTIIGETVQNVVLQEATSSLGWRVY